MNRRRSNKQPDLFPAGVAQVGHNGAPEIRGRETDRLYIGVLFLRIYGGKTVYRVGREHLVGGRQVSTRQLLELTAAEARRLGGSPEIPGFALYRLRMVPRPADYPPA
jgi:hypothetical protein